MSAVSPEPTLAYSGLSAFRGGILAWCDTEGAASILVRPGHYQPLDPLFQPPPMLGRIAETGASFHARPTGARCPPPP